MTRVLVTGATGTIGSAVVAQLQSIGCQVRAMSRNPRPSPLPGVESVAGDLGAPDTLDAALDDVDAVFLVWVLPLTPAAAAIARIASRVDRVVLLTSPHRTNHPFFQQPNGLRAIHAGLEDLIAASRLKWTFLRPTVFASNCIAWWASQIKAGNVVRWFHAEAPTAPIDERDLAAVAVHALAGGNHDGKEYVLTGPSPITLREQLQCIGEVIGRELRYQELTPETARSELSAILPPPVADMLLGAYGAALGVPAYVTTTVRDVTGTPARSFREWAAAHRADFI